MGRDVTNTVSLGMDGQIMRYALYSVLLFRLEGQANKLTEI